MILGCKIKALRNKTNTYIKTPGRGEDPLFIITGQMSNVEDAVTEIERASAHFTNIRATRNRGLAAPSVEGQITDRVGTINTIIVDLCTERANWKSRFNR